MPDADGGHENKPGFGDKVGGFAKKFAGKATGKVSSFLDVMSDGIVTSTSTGESRWRREDRNTDYRTRECLLGT